MISRKGHCDWCGTPPHLHRKAGDVYVSGHTYECDADDRIRRERRDRFVGSVGWWPGYTRRYVPETRMYEVTWNETPMDQCGWPGCSRGAHAEGAWSTVQPGTHDYRRPTDAQLLERMRARRAARQRLREASRGEVWSIRRGVWHAWVEDDTYDEYEANRLYTDLVSALRATRRLLGVSRFVGAVRDGDVRWTLHSDECDVTAIIERRAVHGMERP